MEELWQLLTDNQTALGRTATTAAIVVAGVAVGWLLSRLRLMEIGSADDGTTWVRGRQHTGRVVSVSNKATFTMTRRVYRRMDEAGIAVASSTMDVTVHDPDGSQQDGG